MGLMGVLWSSLVGELWVCWEAVSAWLPGCLLEQLCGLFWVHCGAALWVSCGPTGRQLLYVCQGVFRSCPVVLLQLPLGCFGIFGGSFVGVFAATAWLTECLVEQHCA